MQNGDREEWKDGQAGMEQGNILKPIIDKDFIFTSKYTKTYIGRPSPGPVWGSLSAVQDFLAAMYGEGRECPLRQPSRS